VTKAVGASVHDSTDLDDVVPFRIYQTQRLLRTHLMRFLGDHAEGLSPEQWFIVQRLAQRSPRRQAELSEPVLGDAPNITRLIDALVDRGLVARLPDPDDRRSWLVSLTQSGRQLVTRTRRPVVAARLELFDGLAEEELSALLAMLGRIDANARRILTSE
jgi:DNA-binding MarR family transcriptional regulator